MSTFPIYALVQEQVESPTAINEAYPPFEPMDPTPPIACLHIS